MKNRAASGAGIFCFAAILGFAVPPGADAGFFSAKEIPAAWNAPAAQVDGDGAEWNAEKMTEKDQRDQRGQVLILDISQDSTLLIVE